jgi:hypothetical protein
MSLKFNDDQEGAFFPTPAVGGWTLKPKVVRIRNSGLRNAKLTRRICSDVEEDLAGIDGDCGVFFATGDWSR